MTRKSVAAFTPFTVNVERLKPWHTLTGRQHFCLDHDWMTALGEQLPIYRPPLDMDALFDEPRLGDVGELGVTVRCLTPHNKWSIHSEYQDNLFIRTAIAIRVRVPGSADCACSRSPARSGAPSCGGCSRHDE